MALNWRNLAEGALVLVVVNFVVSHLAEFLPHDAESGNMYNALVGTLRAQKHNMVNASVYLAVLFVLYHVARDALDRFVF